MNPIENQQVCMSAWESLHHGVGRLSNFPGLLKKIISERAWELRQVQNGEVVPLNSLRELITEKPFRGWGEDVRKVEAVLKDEPEVLTLFREAMLGQEGGDKRSDEAITNNNIMGDSATQGTSKSYTLSRLKRDHHELFERVCAGEMSANAAAIEAGFRKIKTPLQELQRWWKKASEEEQRAFLDSVK